MGGWVVGRMGQLRIGSQDIYFEPAPMRQANGLIFA